MLGLQAGVGSRGIDGHVATSRALTGGPSACDGAGCHGERVVGMRGPVLLVCMLPMKQRRVLLGHLCNLYYLSPAEMMERMIGAAGLPLPPGFRAAGTVNPPMGYPSIFPGLFPGDGRVSVG